MYIDLIMDSTKGDFSEIVSSGYEEKTVQSYFTTETIKSLLNQFFEILEFKIIVWMNESGNEYNRRAHLILRNK